MKFSSIRWLFVGGLIGSVVAGVVTSNVGCGSDGAKAGSGGASGGSSGGGTTGTGGGVAPKYSDTFDTDKEAWALSNYPDANMYNWGAALDPDSGVGLDGGVVPTLEWSSTDGDPTPGCLRVTVTFGGFNQYIDPQINIPTPVDLTGRVLKARIRLASGTFPSGGVQFHASSGAGYVYVAAPFINSSSLSSSWITVNLDTATVSSSTATWDPSQVVQIGVQFTTGTPFEGGTLTFGQAVFEIDTVQG